MAVKSASFALLQNTHEIRTYWKWFVKLPTHADFNGINAIHIVQYEDRCQSVVSVVALCERQIAVSKCNCRYWSAGRGRSQLARRAGPAGPALRDDHAARRARVPGRARTSRRPTRRRAATRWACSTSFPPGESHSTIIITNTLFECAIPQISRHRDLWWCLKLVDRDTSKFYIWHINTIISYPYMTGCKPFAAYKNTSWFLYW